MDEIRVGRKFKRKDNNPDVHFSVWQIYPDGWVLTGLADNSRNNAAQQWNGKLPDRYEWIPETTTL